VKTEKKDDESVNGSNGKR